MFLYLVESTKGILSLGNLPTDTNRERIFVLLGPISNLNFPQNLFNNQAVLRIGQINKFELQRLESILKIDNQGVNSKIIIYVTDDTFNIMSFLIVKRLKKSIEKLILIDHLHVDHLYFKDYFSLKNLWNYKKLLLCYPFSFRSILFSNSALGYRLKLNFNEKIYCESFYQNTLIRKIEKKIIILIPFSSKNNTTNREYLQFLDQLLNHFYSLGFKNDFIIKLHPRDKLYNELYGSMFTAIENCVVMDINTPLEFFELSSCLILNLESSFENITNAKVLLLWNIFSNNKSFTANLTGINVNSKDIVVSEILKFLHGREY